MASRPGRHWSAPCVPASRTFTRQRHTLGGTMRRELINLIPRVGSSSVPLPTTVGHLYVASERLDDHTTIYFVYSGSELIYKCSTLRSLRNYLTEALTADMPQPHPREARYGISRITRTAPVFGTIPEQLRQVAVNIEETSDDAIMSNSRQPFSVYLRRQ